MLDIKKRIQVIENLLQEDTAQSLTYAALESRLTLEYLCYERFKLFYSFLSAEDLKDWRPKHVVKQVAQDISEMIDKSFVLSISTTAVTDKRPMSKADYEALEYVPIGRQAALNLSKLGALWQGLANVALHIPVPTISSGELHIYGDKEHIRKKVLSVVDFLSSLTGNLLMGGPLGQVFSFSCDLCGIALQRPVKSLTSPTLVHCINPECIESYVLEKESSGSEDIKITRRVFRFECKKCSNDLDVPAKAFKELKLDQQLNIRCQRCAALLTVIMRPLVREEVEP